MSAVKVHFEGYVLVAVQRLWRSKDQQAREHRTEECGTYKLFGTIFGWSSEEVSALRVQVCCEDVERKPTHRFVATNQFPFLATQKN